MISFINNPDNLIGFQLEHFQSVPAEPQQCTP